MEAIYLIEPSEVTRETVLVAQSRAKLEVILAEHQLLPQCVSPYGEKSLYSALADQLCSSLSTKLVNAHGIFLLVKDKLGESDLALLRKSLRQGTILQSPNLLTRLAGALQSDLAIYAANYANDGGFRVFKASQSAKPVLRLCYWEPHHFDSLRTSQEEDLLVKWGDRAREFELKFREARDEALALLPGTEGELAKYLREAIPPKVTIGLLGDTAQGKSSLLNACFGSLFLPVGDLGPCTASALRLEATSSLEFQIRLEFVSQEELAADFATFFELAGKKNRTDAEKKMIKALVAKCECTLGKKLTGRNKPNTSEQHAIRAGHGLRPELRNLILQRSKTFTLTKLGDAYDILTEYTIMPKDFRKAYQHKGKWPIVREVHISGPIPHLPFGLIVLDLPGTNDSNVLRIQKTKRALKDCQHVFLVDDMQYGFQRESAEELFEMIKELDFSRISAILTKWDLKCEDRATFKTYHIDKILPEEQCTPELLRLFSAIEAEKLVRSKFEELLTRQEARGKLATDEDRARAEMRSRSRAEKAKGQEENDENEIEEDYDEESDWAESDGEAEEDGETEEQTDTARAKLRSRRRINYMTLLPVSARACDNFVRTGRSSGFLRAQDTGIPKLHHKFEALARQRVITMEANLATLVSRLNRLSGIITKEIPYEDEINRFSPETAVRQSQALLRTHMQTLQSKLRSYNPQNQVALVSDRGNWASLKYGNPPTLWCAIRDRGVFTSKSQYIPKHRRGKVLLNDDIAEGFVDTFFNNISDVFEQHLPAAVRFLQSWLMNVVSQIQTKFPTINTRLQSAAQAAWTSSLAQFNTSAEEIRALLHTTNLREVVLEQMTPFYERAGSVKDDYYSPLIKASVGTLDYLRHYISKLLNGLANELEFFFGTFDRLRQFFNGVPKTIQIEPPAYLVKLRDIFETLGKDFPRVPVLSTPSLAAPTQAAPSASIPPAPPVPSACSSRACSATRSFPIRGTAHEGQRSPPPPQSRYPRHSEQPFHSELCQALLAKFAALQLARAEEESEGSDVEEF